MGTYDDYKKKPVFPQDNQVHKKILLWQKNFKK